jgi:hypothetical protein
MSITAVEGPVTLVTLALVVSRTRVDDRGFDHPEP